MEDTQVERIGDHLEYKKIALAITGGIAAIEAPKIARHFRRYGAEVQAYVTPAAMQFVGKTALEWGTGRQIVSEMSGLAEHINRHDAVVVAPATLNTINKIRYGIADTPVTTLVASALGQKTPVFVAPTMHESLALNPFYRENIEALVQAGVYVITPRTGEGKLKMPEIDTIVAKVIHDTATLLKGKKILVTGGPTPVRIDDVRIITNVFTGGTAMRIAKEAYLRGADVTLLLAASSVANPSYVTTKRHADFDEYYANVFGELQKGYDIGIFSAAVADYKPAKKAEGKIPSGGELTRIDLVQTPKVIRDVHKTFPNLKMITFKYELGVSSAEIQRIAQERIKDGYDIVVANRGEDKTDNAHKAYIVGRKGVLDVPLTPNELAKSLIEIVGKL